MDTDGKKEKPSYQETYARLRGGYIERLEKSSAQIAALLAVDLLQPHDLQYAQKLAHGLAGSGAVFGFPGVTEAGRAVDTFLDTPPDDEGIKALRSLLADLKRACEAGVRDGGDAEPPPLPEKPAFRLVRNPHVILVEDDTDFAHLVTLRLGQHKIRCTAVTDGKAMQKAMKKEAPDLILLDIGLPGDSGHVILKKLKEHPRTARTPVLMLTAKKREQDVIGALNAGAVGYVVKGDDRDEMISRILQHINRLRPSVLIADNDVLVLKLLDGKFTENGFHVLLAEDGVKALRLVGERTPHIVVLDRMMPGISGLDLLARMRAKDATAAVPVVMLSARAGPADIAEGLEAGAQEYVAKPFDSDRLVETAIRLLRLNSVVE